MVLQFSIMLSCIKKGKKLMQIWIKGKTCINNHSSSKLLIHLVLPWKNWWKNCLPSTRLWSLTSTSKLYHSNDLFQLCVRWIDYFYYWFLTRQLANQTTVEPSKKIPLKYGKKVQLHLLKFLMPWHIELNNIFRLVLHVEPTRRVKP